MKNYGDLAGKLTGLVTKARFLSQMELVKKTNDRNGCGMVKF